MAEDQEPKTGQDKSHLDDAVHELIASEGLITQEIHKYVPPDTLVEKISDAITLFSGSWTFLALLLAFILGWMTLMSRLDPFPYILLNLIISVVCVCQSPFILMSNGRKENRDDDRDQQSYAINLKNEVQIRSIIQQQDRILELLERHNIEERK